MCVVPALPPPPSSSPLGKSEVGDEFQEILDPSSSADWESKVTFISSPPSPPPQKKAVGGFFFPPYHYDSDDS